MENFLKLLSGYEQLSDSFIEALKERIVRSSPRRGHLLLEASQISKNVYYLKKGFAASFHHLRKNKHIEALFKEGSLIISSKSFLQRLPSQESIEVLEAGELFMISHDSVMWLSERFQEAKCLYLVPMINHIENTRARMHDLQLLDAQERYEKLKESHPSVFQLLPLAHLAPYLGMSVQTLSRQRREDDDYQPKRRKNRNK
jgi:hypothetical protein